MNQNILAERVRSIYTGRNWSSTNLKETLEQVSLEQAKHRHSNTNSILALTFHIN